MIDFVLPIKIDDEKRWLLLRQTLKTLEQNTPMHFINRLVIVNDCGTYPLPYGFPNTELPIVLINNETQLGVGGSKNKAVDIHTQMGRGEYLYMFDGDVYFKEGWVEAIELAEHHAGDRFKIIAGGVHPYLQQRLAESADRITSHDALSGWSWMLTYDTWDKYGKLADNSLGTGKSEDWEYCQRIRNDGYLVGCVQPQVIAHCGLTNTEGQPIPGADVSRELALQVAPQALLL